MVDKRILSENYSLGQTPRSTINIFPIDHFQTLFHNTNLQKKTNKAIRNILVQNSINTFNFN